MKWDAIIIGAGAYGLMTAVFAARRGRKVLLLERNEQAGKKILISGGGRCNYTNLHTSSENFISDNPHFTRNILSRWRVQDTIDFFARYGIHPAEKTLGQLFPLSNKARDFRDGLLHEALTLGAEIHYGIRVKTVTPMSPGFEIRTEEGISFVSEKLVIATGGKSIPPLGATDFGLQLASSWGMKLIPDAPALVPFTAEKSEEEVCSTLSGLSVDAVARLGKTSFREAVLFTHKGWSGPAILQISSYWKQGDQVEIDCLPNWELSATILGTTPPVQWLSDKLPSRFLSRITEEMPFIRKRPAEISRKDFQKLEQRLKHLNIHPSGTLGYAKAEVMRGGVDTRELIPQTLESKKVPGSYWGGEVIDVTGWLGGYNFQWAWACGVATGNVV